MSIDKDKIKHVSKLARISVDEKKIIATPRCVVHSGRKIPPSDAGSGKIIAIPKAAKSHSVNACFLSKTNILQIKLACT